MIVELRKADITSYPLDMSVLKMDLRLMHDDLDLVLVNQYIPGAFEWAESFLKRSLVQREHVLTLSDWPPAAIEIPGGSVTAIASIEYEADGTQTLTDYQSFFGVDASYIAPDVGDSWPALDDVLTPVTVTYTAGYVTVPAAIRRGLTAYIYGAMELDGLLTIKPGFDSKFAEKLISPYRIVRA